MYATHDYVSRVAAGVGIGRCREARHAYVSLLLAWAAAALQGGLAHKLAGCMRHMTMCPGCGHHDGPLQGG